MTTYDCAICGKPTRSHELSKSPAIYVCHVCFTSEPDEVARIKKMIEDAHKVEAEKMAEMLISILKARRMEMNKCTSTLI